MLIFAERMPVKAPLPVECTSLRPMLNLDRVHVRPRQMHNPNMRHQNTNSHTSYLSENDSLGNVLVKSRLTIGAGRYQVTLNLAAFTCLVTLQIRSQSTEGLKHSSYSGSRVPLVRTPRLFAGASNRRAGSSLRYRYQDECFWAGMSAIRSSSQYLPL